MVEGLTFPDMGKDQMQGQLHVIVMPSDAFPGANMIAPTNINATRTVDICGIKELIRDMYFTLYLRLYGNSNLFREQNAEFMSDFIHWAEEEQEIFDAMPKFGDEPDTEVFKFSGGMLFNISEAKPDWEDYLLQLHIRYKLIYEE